MRNTLLKGTLAGLLLAASTSLHATIIQPSAITASTADFGGGFPLVNQINQSGLSSAYTAGVTDFDSYVAVTTHNGASAVNSGFSDGPFGQFSYDLGSAILIDALGLWETDNSGSVASFDLYSDTDFLFGNGGTSLLGSFAATAAGPTAASVAQVFSFAGVTTQFLHIDINTTAGGSQPGLGEVIFRGSASSAAVPAPGVLFLLAIGMLGLTRVRRQAR